MTTSGSTVGSRNNRLVLDSFALLAYFFKEPNGDTVRGLLRRAAHRELKPYLSVINLGECFYMAWRKGGSTKAQSIIRTIHRLPITLAEITEARALRAATIKAIYSGSKQQLSFADAFAVALAEELDCPVVTDDPEFRAVESLITVTWLSPQ